MLFRDRQDAGKQLAARLAFLRNDVNVLVLGIPRGGVVVAAEIANALNVPLGVFIAHKIGAPTNPELALGAVTSTGAVWLDEELITELHVTEADLVQIIEYQRAEIARRLAMYPRVADALENKTVVIVDDGIATGATMFAALRGLRRQNPARVILAIPVAPADAIVRLTGECDQMIALATPATFYSLGQFYVHFDQTSDAQVIALLESKPVRPKSRNKNPSGL